LEGERDRKVRTQQVLEGQRGRRTMKDSILNGKSILAVNDNPEILAVLEKEILQSCRKCTFDTATTFKEADQRLASFTYHLIIVDIMGDYGFDLLQRALIKKIPVTTLTVRPFNLEALKRSFETNAISSLPKENLGEVVPLLEDVLAHKHLPPWKRPIEKLKRFFDLTFESDPAKGGRPFSTGKSMKLMK